LNRGSVFWSNPRVRRQGANTQRLGVALDSELTLTEQPRGVQLEYRIIAVNNGGNSVPSNTADVVL
jgi:hypothetical protein